MFFLEKAIVYGSTLDAYTCVQTLMSMGLSGENIVMVQPPPQYEVGSLLWQVPSYLGIVSV